MRKSLVAVSSDAIKSSLAKSKRPDLRWPRFVRKLLLSQHNRIWTVTDRAVQGLLPDAPPNKLFAQHPVFDLGLAAMSTRLVYCQRLVCVNCIAEIPQNLVFAHLLAMVTLVWSALANIRRTIWKKMRAAFRTWNQSKTLRRAVSVSTHGNVAKYYQRPATLAPTLAQLLALSSTRTYRH